MARREASHFLYCDNKSILNLVSFCCPLVKVVDGMRVVNMDAGYVTQLSGFVDFFVDEIVIKIDVGGIYLGVSIVDAFYTGPIEGAQAHGAGLATAVYNASVEFEIAVDGASTPDSVHLGMSSRVVVEGDSVAACSYHLAVFNDNRTERTTPTVDVLTGNVAGHLDELAVLFCDLYRLHVECSLFLGGFVSYRTIVKIHLASGNVVEFATVHLLADGGNAVDKQLALEVVKFMLNHACKISLDILVVFLPILVKPIKVNA